MNEYLILLKDIKNIISKYLLPSKDKIKYNKLNNLSDLQTGKVSEKELDPSKFGMGCDIQTTEINPLWEEIQDDVKNIDWSKVLDENPTCDWPIDSAIVSGLFDEDDMKIIKLLLVKAIKKMSVVNQYKLYNQYS
jgi:hypothetical protein